ETASHLFFHCRHVERLWKWVTDRWKDATGKVVTISEKKIISGFPFGSRKAKKDGRTIVWVNLCVEVLWSIWSERNRCAFDNGTFCYNTLLNILKFNIRDTLKALEVNPLVPPSLLQQLYNVCK